MSDSTVRVSVILVNWNRLDDVRFTLDRMEEDRSVPMEIIVADNGSTDGSVEALRDDKRVRLVEVGENLGPGVARNRAAAEARGEYLLFMDSDAHLEPGSIRPLVEKLDAEPDIAIAGCHVKNWFTQATDQWIYGPDHATHVDQCFDTYSFSAAGAMVRRDVFEQIGGYWEELFMCNEEVELSLQAHALGYRIIYFPQAVAWHRDNPEGRINYGRYWRLQSRNWLWIFYRFYPSPLRQKMIRKYVGVYLVKGLAMRQLGPCLQGLREGLAGRDLIGQYPEKLPLEVVRAYESLNPRRRLRLGRWLDKSRNANPNQSSTDRGA